MSEEVRKQIQINFSKLETQGFIFSYLLHCSSNFRQGVGEGNTGKLAVKYLSKGRQDTRCLDVNSSGIIPLKPQDIKYFKILKAIDSCDYPLYSQVQNINYFTIPDTLSARLFRCVSGTYYDKISVYLKKEKKNIIWLIPSCFIAVSQQINYRPLKQLINNLIMLKITPSKLTVPLKKLQDSSINQIISEGKLQDFIIACAMYSSEIKGGNHKVEISLIPELPPIIQFYNKNDIQQPFLNLICPSNSSFDQIILNHTPINLFYLVTCILQEFQIIITANKQSSSTLFCENLMTLIQPMKWKGIYLPTCHQSFDFRNEKSPFIIATVKNKGETEAERLKQKPHDMVIYDVDLKTFIYKHDDIPVPLSYKAYLLKNLQMSTAELKFKDEKGIPPNNSLTAENIIPSPNSNYPGKQMNSNDTSRNSPRGGGTTIASTGQQIQLDYAFFNKEEYLKSFGAADYPFFEKVSKTTMFAEFIKQCFMSIDFRAEYIQQMRLVQQEYSFHQIFLYVSDCRYLAKRGKTQTLNDKIVQIENLQNHLISCVDGANKTNLTSTIQSNVPLILFPEIKKSMIPLAQDFLNGLLQTRESDEGRTTGRNNRSQEFIFPSQLKNYVPQTKYLQQMSDADKQMQESKGKVDYQLHQLGLIENNQLPNDEGSQQQIATNGLANQLKDGQERQFQTWNQPSKNNLLEVCNISQIEAGPEASLLCINKVEEKDFVQQLLTNLVPSNPPKVDDWDLLSTIASQNNLEAAYEIVTKQKHLPNSLQLFHTKNCLENRHSQEALPIISSNQLLSPINRESSQHPNQISLFTSRSYSPIIEHQTTKNTNSIAVLSPNSSINMRVLENETTQSKPSPTEKPSENTLPNSNKENVEPQEIKTSTFQPKKGVFGSLQAGCFNMWGHYLIEEGNLDLV